MALHLVYEKARVPSTRIRLRALVPLLEARGWRCRVVARPVGAGARRRFEAALSPGDVVLVHRVRPTRREARWWRRLPATLVYDFDDAIMLGRRRGLRGRIERARRGAGFRRMLAAADAVTCGNAFLAGQCGDFAGPVCVLPSSVPADVPQASHRTRDPGAAAPLRVGWVGRRGNLHALRALAAPLARVAAARPLRLVVLCDAPLSLPGVPGEWIPWEAEREAAEVARFDVGVMPLPDDPWSRGKCGYKLLQYMAAGVPGVASPVGVNARLVRDGENGLLARDAAGWETALRRLADDPALRARLGAAGRRTVLAGYTCEGAASRLSAFLGALRGQSAASVRSTAAATEKSAARARSRAGDGG